MVWYDQMGTPHATQRLAWLANVWDYDPSAGFEDDYDQDTDPCPGCLNGTRDHDAQCNAAALVGASVPWTPGLLAPDHYETHAADCIECMPF